MKSRRKLLAASRLYVILDRLACAGQDAAGLADVIARAGADLIQYRDTVSSMDFIAAEARRICRVLRPYNTLFIVNNYPHLARSAGADGVHLGQQDVLPRAARRIVGADRIIGISAHNLKQAREAERLGADYLGFGPLFATITKPEYRPIGVRALKALSSQAHIPFFVIGGITGVNLRTIRAAGIHRVAVCRAILKSADIDKTVKYYKKILL